MNICVVGAGYVGLVTGACLAELGHRVVVVDKNESVVDGLCAGKLHIHEQRLEGFVARNVAAGRLAFAKKIDEGVCSADVFFVAVGTPQRKDGSADTSAVFAAAKEIFSVLESNSIDAKLKKLIVKSTVPVGTNHDLCALAKSAGVKIDIFSNPEFLREGTAIDDFVSPDRVIVGGPVLGRGEENFDYSKQLSTEAFFRDMYRVPLRVPVLAMSAESAELAKYAANAMLACRIALTNEIARVCSVRGACITDVMRGVGLDSRIGDAFLRAGIGYGGSCFPKDVSALIHMSANLCQLLPAIRASNEAQSRVVTDLVAREYGADLSGKTFALWGLAFKPNTDDVRDSPATKIAADLISRGARIRAYDPKAKTNAAEKLSAVHRATSALDALEGSDALIVATEWVEFMGFDPRKIADALKDKTVFDGRNIFNPREMRCAGLKYFSIGRT